MDLPQPPADIELKNIIDKLAQFVARNGPEFEQMTKNKQKDNPKFSFLFGGELFNYYQYKVTTEQAILKVKAAVQSNAISSSPGTPAPPPPPLPPGCGPIGYGGEMGENPSPPSTMTPMQIMNAAAANSGQWLIPKQPPAIDPAFTLTTILEQQNVLQQQITQSEQNLAAQHTALTTSNDSLIDDSIRKFQMERLSQRAIETGVSLSEFDAVLQPIIDSCTKDSISSGKAWILCHSSKGAHDVIAEYLLFKVLSHGVPFTQKLHMIYLINDVMHHCVRKNSDILKQALEDVVVPMFCNSWTSGSKEQQEKLSKLVNLWENKNTYFSTDVIRKLRLPEQSWEECQEERLAKYSDIASAIKINSKTTFESYRAQHDLFVNHAITQIQTLENEKMQIEKQQQQQQQLQQQQQQQQQQEVQSLQLQIQQLPPPLLPNDGPMPFESAPLNLLPPGGPPPFMQPPPDFSHLPPELLPDFSRPPPGFQPEPVTDDLIPTVPYYELPAGLMIPLIKIDDFNYKPLDPKKLRLPPAVPPTERLMQAVEAFYQKAYNGNSRDRLILDADGWEKLGLYEYYKAKNAAKKNKELEIESGMREKSRSPSPIKRERSRSRSPRKKRVYKSKSPSPEKVEKVERPRSRSRSRSRSPPRRSNGKKSPRRAARPSRRSRSRSKSRSQTPPPAPPRTRSPTPPSFATAFGKLAEEKLDESNKGHQMLKKMGWGGAGLGSKEQGMEDPISGGDVRDRVDLYKGVGVNLHDPYESFRKNKGKAFVTRMKARAEERAME